MSGCLYSVKRTLSCLMAGVFLVSAVVPSCFAQGGALSAPGQMVGLTPSFQPCILRGLKLDAKAPFHFQFIVDEGDSGFAHEELKAESEVLIKFFLATLTTPEKDIWVNLSPYESDRIIATDFGRTTMGRELLAQDYLLKQLTSSLMHPDSRLGKKFWEEVYKNLAAKFGTIDIPVDTFNKVWIVPQRAVIYEGRDVPGEGKSLTAFIDEAKLRVMLESDYLAANASSVAELPAQWPQAGDTQNLAKDIIRQVILPALEKEVNEGKGFARLRQVYHSLLLAVWLKKKLQRGSVKEISFDKSKNILSLVFVDQNKTAGLETLSPESEVRGIYDLYVQAFRKGVYDLVKDEYDQYSGEVIPRKYFSGGVKFGDAAQDIEVRAGFPQRDMQNPRIVDVNLERTRMGFGRLAKVVAIFTGVVAGFALMGQVVFANPLQNEEVTLKRVLTPIRMQGQVEAQLKRSHALSLIESAGIGYHEVQVRKKGVRAGADVLSAAEISARMKISPVDFYDLVHHEYQKYDEYFSMAGLSEVDIMAFVLATAAFETTFESGKVVDGLYFGFGGVTKGVHQETLHFAHTLRGSKLSDLKDARTSIRFLVARAAQITPQFVEIRDEIKPYVQDTSGFHAYRDSGLIVALYRAETLFGNGEKPKGFFAKFVRSAFSGNKKGKGVSGKVSDFMMIWHKIVSNPADASEDDRAQAISGVLPQKVDPLGGIDLQTRNMELIMQGQGGDIEFELTIDQVNMLRQNIPGFVPIILDIKPAADYRMFLGLSGKGESAS